MRIVYKFRSSPLDLSSLRCYIENVCSGNFGKFSQKHSWWAPVQNCKAYNYTKIGLHRGCIPRNFPKSVSHFVTCEQLLL